MADDIIMIPLNIQCIAFLHAVAAGGLIAICFVLLNAAKKVFNVSNGVVVFTDIFCCILPVVTVFLLSIKFCSGKLRWYMFVGEIIGFAIIKLTAGNTAYKIFCSVLFVIYNALVCVILAVTTPIRVAYKFLFLIAAIFRKIVYQNTKKVFSKCKLCLKYSIKTLYNSFIRIGMSKNSSGKEVGRLARRKKRGSGFLVKIITLSFIACAAVSFIHSQSEVASKRRELAAINESIELQQIENDEVRRILDGDNDLEYIERIAREKLGYAYPDEKIFIDRSGG